MYYLSASGIPESRTLDLYKWFQSDSCLVKDDQYLGLDVDCENDGGVVGNSDEAKEELVPFVNIDASVRFVNRSPPFRAVVVVVGTLLATDSDHESARSRSPIAVRFMLTSRMSFRISPLRRASTEESSESK